MWDLFEPRQFEFNHGELKWSCKCPKCGKKFNQRCKLMHHITTKHNSIRAPNGKLYQCQYCLVKFIHKQSLRTHVETHHANDNADGSGANFYSFLFMCRECHETFDCDYNLWCHMMLHALNRPADHSEDVKQYQCSQCSLKFLHKKDLKKHKGSFHNYSTPQLIISDDKQQSQESTLFGCDLCEQKFTTKRHLKSHRSSEHRNERVISVSDSFEKAERPYKCRVCKTRFAQRMYLKWHMNLHRQRSPITVANLFDSLKCGIKFDLLAHQRWHLTSEKEKILRSQSERLTLDLSLVDNFGNRFKKMMQNVGSAVVNFLLPELNEEKKGIHGVNKAYRNTTPNWYA